MGVTDARRRILLSAPHPVTTTPASVATFDTDMVGMLRSAKFSFLPVQSGSGDPSPTNVRSISGWDGLTVTRCGKNLWNDDNTSYYANTWTRSGHTYSTNRSAATYISLDAYVLFAGITYTLSFYLDSVNADMGKMQFRSADGTIVASKASITTIDRHSLSYTPSVTGQYKILVGGMDNGEVTLSNIQLELGSTATAYAPYTGSTYPVSWQSAGTIYGGYVDVCKGVVVADRALVPIKSTSLYGSVDVGTYGNILTIEIPGIYKGKNESVILYTAFKRNMEVSMLNLPMWNIGSWSGNQRYMQICAPFETKQAFGEYLDAQDPPFYALYELATPITYALTPQIIKSLRGVNNLWSTGNGDAQVTYWTHKGGIIPVEYQRVAYLESSGTQYITTDVLPSNTLGFDCTFYSKSNVTASADYGCIFGSRYASGDNDCQVTTFTTNSALLAGTFRFGNTNGYNPGIIKETIQSVSKRNSTFINATGDSITVRDNEWDGAKRKSMYLFLLNNNDTPVQGGLGCRIYVMRFYDGGILIHNFIPCVRKSDSKPGMYDTVSKTFLTNAGTGEFIVPA